jgi:RNA-directed DNA polymerase
MDRLDLKLHPTKTRMVDLRRGREGFVFLGCTNRKRRSVQRNPRWHFLQRWPSPKAMNRLRERVRTLTSSRRSGLTLTQLIQRLNPVLRGWSNYFRTGTSEREFQRIDGYVVRRLWRWHHRSCGQRLPRRRGITLDWYHRHGLYRLRGTVCYPAQATPVRSSLSRVRANRTHGLIGGS